MNSHFFVSCRIGFALTALVVLGAAAPPDMRVQMEDVGPLAQPAPAPAKALSFQNTIYRAAPMPDPDAGPPSSGGQPETQIVPKFMSPQTLFQGDGYAYASSEQGTLDRRKNPAAGLGLNVPVK